MLKNDYVYKISCLENIAEDFPLNRIAGDVTPGLAGKGHVSFHSSKGRYFS